MMVGLLAGQKESQLRAFSCIQTVVNNPKWFTSLHPANLDIATANGKANLTILGGGRVSFTLQNDKGDICELELSEVAFAPDRYIHIRTIAFIVSALRAFLLAFVPSSLPFGTYP